MSFFSGELFSIHIAVGSEGLKVDPRGKEASSSWIQGVTHCFPLVVFSCMNHFRFIMSLFWALPSLLDCFSYITQEMMRL